MNSESFIIKGNESGKAEMYEGKNILSPYFLALFDQSNLSPDHKIRICIYTLSGPREKLYLFNQEIIEEKMM